MRLDLPGDRYTRATTPDYSKTTVWKSVFAPVEAPTIDVPLPGASRFEQTLATVARRLGGTSPTATQGARPVLKPSAGTVKPVPTAPPSAPSVEPIPPAPPSEPSIQPIPPAPPSAPSFAEAAPPTSRGTSLIDWGLAPGRMPGEYTPAPAPKPTPAPKTEPTPAAEWRQPYTPPPAPRIEPPAPPPPEAIRGPVPVEGVPAPETPAPEAPRPELQRGPGGFEREVTMPVGFSLPTPERLSEIWQEVTGRPATEEERRYFESPQFLRVLSGRIPMWQAADPIWRRFFQLLGIIRNRLEG